MTIVGRPGSQGRKTSARNRWLRGTAALLALQFAWGALPAGAQTSDPAPVQSAPAESIGEERPLAGSAYEVATEAYEAYANGNYAAAVEKAREAVRQRPDVGRLRTLLVRALDASGEKGEARSAAQEGAQDKRLTDTAREELSALATALTASSEAVSQSDPAYLAADAAYRAYDRGDYDTAVAKAEEALRLTPGNRDYRSLLDNALAAQKLSSAQQSAKKGSGAAPGAGAANIAYDAIRAKRYGEALRLARRAVQQAPGNRSFRLLLIQTLVQNGHQSEALSETDRAMKRFGRDAALLRQRGVLQASMGNQNAAFDDFSAALRYSSSPADERFLRLSLAEAALATDRPEQAYEALAPLGRRADHAVWMKRGQALQDMKDFAGANDAFALAETTTANPREQDQAIAARVRLLNDEDRKAEASRLFLETLDEGRFASMSDLDLAYLAGQAGERTMAYDRFQAADRNGALSGRQFIDAAYAARRAYQNDDAIALMHRAIDAEERGDFSLAPQALFGLRREVAELKREYGAYVSLTHGGMGIASNSLLPQGSSGESMQLGSEIYWRPPGIGYRDGATFELFARQFTTLRDSLDGATGSSTTQGSVGARWKPFAQHNLVFEASKLFKVGKHSRNDTLIRAAFSKGIGSDLRVDVPSWWMAQYYGEIGHYLESGQTIASDDIRIGRSFRMDAIDDRLVLTPYIGVNAGYDSELADQFTLSAGPGLNARYWFREDKYTAPMSYIDLTVQYRARLAGDNRGEGLFAGISLSY
ncbi:bacteriophage N4 adsorption protein A (plasmid) [Nitratireductor aquimarinus]|uniref:bacteriophage N4 adsorption protein A n=1 Tax=Nitratireductor aquimarinus TaxID=889300 RepID=UPI003B5933D2